MKTAPSRFRPIGVIIAVVLLVLVPLTAPTLTRSQDQGVVINQIYAGGQSSQAPLRADYVELFNPGSDPVALDGWSVQYAADDGTTWRGTTLSGSIPAGGFYLVRGGAGRGRHGAAHPRCRRDPLLRQWQRAHRSGLLRGTPHLRG